MKNSTRQVVELNGASGPISFFMDHIVAFSSWPNMEGCWIITTSSNEEWHVTDSYKEIITIMERFGS